MRRPVISGWKCGGNFPSTYRKDLAAFRRSMIRSLGACLKRQSHTLT